MVEGHKPQEPSRKVAKVLGGIVGSGLILHGISAFALATQPDAELKNNEKSVILTEQGAVEVVAGSIVLFTTFSRRKR
ncbi:MAG: hypothetical protein KBC00_02055 [Candidatus Levybacteria bacterium]|nr:hypothetical protein [Candidatus Levybacteria bacterium]MBP9815388.1 hypothetical protein [Candidatus Levybacteria bacterium]